LLPIKQSTARKRKDCEMTNRKDSMVSYVSDTESRRSSVSPTPSLLEIDGESEGYASDWSAPETPRGGSPLSSFSIGHVLDNVATHNPPGPTFTIYEDPQTPPRHTAFVDTPERDVNRSRLSSFEDGSDSATIRETSPVPRTPETYVRRRATLSPMRSTSPYPLDVPVPSLAGSSSFASLPPGVQDNPEESSDTEGYVNDENAPPSDAPAGSREHRVRKRRAPRSTSPGYSSSRDSSPSPSQRQDPSTAPHERPKRSSFHKRPRR
jgi:hypothetical protein